MFGPKKLSTVRAEIRAAFAKEFDDPIAWLEAQFSSAKRRGGEGAEVLESLKRLLEVAPKRKGELGPD
jgi:hypothetical protein